MPEAVVRKAFGEGLIHLNQDMVLMAGLAQSAIRKAVDALIHRNTDEAKEVFQLDREIYRLQRQVEGECTDLIALHAPVARDLRTITTVLKISTDIDRIGRGAKNIAEIALELAPLDPVKPKKLEKLSRNADLAIHMVDQAIRAFVDRNDQGVREMAMFDDAVDNLHQEIFEDIVAGLKDRSLKAEVGTRYILVNRHIERIADHAVNIAERVVYLVSGEPPRTPGKAPPEHGAAEHLPAQPPSPESAPAAPSTSPPPGDSGPANPPGP
ncbi:MAG: phosphate signaling complex protein PhoU [Thermoplasmata archaeon]|nr:phosphate signaling complex protein PhoU [Thermoplasmata archaeon]